MKLDPKVYERAAELVIKGKLRGKISPYSCDCIRWVMVRELNGGYLMTEVHADEFIELFSPQEGKEETADWWNLHNATQESQSMRCLALLFMAEIAKDME